jgi:aminoglycoside/choline kinase family phosphotransferase
VYEESRKENANARFASVTRFLEASGMPVPKLLADLPDANSYATEFAPGGSLEDAANGKNADFIKLYRPVLELMQRLWSLPSSGDGVPEFESGFSPELFAWERDLFAKECVAGRYGMETIPEDALKELESVSEKLSSVKQVLVHRDFQSANVLYRTHDKSEPLLIDYQGMRPGPAAYDVASLLFDPYVPMDGATRKLLIELAVKSAPDVLSEDMVALAAVQRLCQALGAFCRLTAAGQSRFEGYIVRALANLQQASLDASLSAFAEFVHGLMHCEKMR